MSIKYHQISLNEIFSDCQTKLIEEAPSFFQILSEHFRPERIADGYEETAFLRQCSGIGYHNESVHLQMVIVAESERFMLDHPRSQMLPAACGNEDGRNTESAYHTSLQSY